MTCTLRNGARSWSGVRDEEGHREYKVKLLVDCDPTDGPANVMQTPGLPVYGTQWLIEGDVDVWAWCRHNLTVTPKVENEPNTLFELEYTFGTKPPDLKSCNQNQVENPLLMPPKCSGTFTKYTEEATFDRFGLPILNSAFELIRGPHAEFDKNRPQIKIEMNVPTFDTVILAYSMIDNVNDAPIWGFNRRCVKLSNAPWERKYYGTCTAYYTVTLEFDVRPDTFDRNVLDEGTKVIIGHWDTKKDSVNFGHYIQETWANPQNASHFMRFKDFNGENARAVLDGEGYPLSGYGTGTPGLSPGSIHVEKYDENDFTQLGVPLSF